MRLYSSALERALRKRARAIVKASPALKKEARRGKRVRRIQAGALFWRVMALVFSMWLLSLATQVGRAGQMVVLTIWSTLAICALVRGLSHHLYETGDVAALHYLPASDRFIFRRQWGEFLRRTAPVTIFEFAVLLGYLCLMDWTRGASGGWAALPLAVALQGLVLVALTLIAAGYAPGIPYHLILWLAIVGLVGPAWLGRKFFIPLFLGIVEKVSHWPFWILPTGWAAHSFSESLREEWLSALLPIPAVVFLMALARRAFARMQEQYTLGETVSPSAHEAAAAAARDGQEEPGEPFAGSAGVTAIEDRIGNGGFLDLHDWSSEPLIERTVASLLSEREEKITAAMLARGRWTRGWKRAAVILLALAALALAGGRSWFGPMLFYAGGAMALLAVIPLLNPLSPGFAPLFVSGTNIPLHAGFPLAFREIARIIFKVGIVRWVAALPLVVLYAAFCGWLSGAAVLHGALLGLKGSWILLVAQPCLVVLYFSSQSNDTLRLTFRHALRFLLLLLFLVGLLAGAIAFILASSAFWASLSGLSAALFSALLYVSYCRFYNRGVFDLIQQPQ